MLLVAFVSLGVFISLGWIRRPSGRRTGAVLGRGLVEALAGTGADRRRRGRDVDDAAPRDRHEAPPGRRPSGIAAAPTPADDRDHRDDEPDDDAAHHGSE